MMKTIAGFAAAMMTAGMFAFSAAAAVDVGVLSQPGDTLTVPLAFDGRVFNSVLDTSGLTFTIAPGQSGPVKLEVLTGTKNVVAAAAVIGQSFGVAAELPLTVISESLDSGLHKFAIGVVASGAAGSAIISRLTLTPVPAALSLGLTGLAVLGGLALNRRGKPALSRAMAA